MNSNKHFITLEDMYLSHNILTKTFVLPVVHWNKWQAAEWPAIAGRWTALNLSLEIRRNSAYDSLWRREHFVIDIYIYIYYQTIYLYYIYI